jgi:HEAT repeat protein
MDPEARLRTIAWLLDTALDNQEEYLYEGEMSSYVRSYASDAAAELRQLFQQTGMTPMEIAYCVAAISPSERIARGSSKQLLVRLGEESRPLLVALATAIDARLRLFAIETANHNTSQAHRSRPRPLSMLIADVPHLLDDPDEDVRLAAASSSAWMWSNVSFIQQRAQADSGHIVIQLYKKFLALLDDPSARVRAAAATALGSWAAEVASEALMNRLEREGDPNVRRALAVAIGSNAPGTQ